MVATLLGIIPIIPHPFSATASKIGAFYNILCGCMAWLYGFEGEAWQTFAGFKHKSGLNIPYILFKAKNVTETSVREKNFSKLDLSRREQDTR